MGWPETQKAEVEGEIKTQQTSVREVDIHNMLRLILTALEDIRHHLRIITDEEMED